MIYKISVDNEQFEYIQNRDSCIALIPHDDSITKNRVEFLEIHSGDNILICEKFANDILSSFDEVINNYNFNRLLHNSAIDFYKDKSKFILESCGKISCIRIWAYLLGENYNSNLGLIPVTLFLYEGIQKLRHLPIENKFFKKYLTNDTKTMFLEITNMIEVSIQYLRNQIEYSTYLNLIRNFNLNDKYHLNDIIELFEKYHNISNLNDFQLERIQEIENAINVIKLCFKKSKFQNIRDIAYDIHNVPEMIRTLNDWRN